MAQTSDALTTNLQKPSLVQNRAQDRHPINPSKSKSNSHSGVVFGEILPEPRRPEPRTNSPSVFWTSINESDPNQIAYDERPQWRNRTECGRSMDVREGSRKDELRIDMTHHKIKKINVVIMIMTDQLATANVCNLLFLGILAGTNLVGSPHTRLGQHLHKKPPGRGQRVALNSMFALSAATGVVVSLDRRSLRREADKLLEAAESARPGSILSVT